MIHESGRLLQNRFVLQELIGSGGMWGALDLQRQEAEESYPFLVTKLLNKYFAKHKNAFIALRREASKTRLIPSQNINDEH